jgi:hypothetical protein
MARLIHENNVQNLQNNQEKEKKHNLNDNNFNMTRFEKSPIIKPQ